MQLSRLGVVSLTRLGLSEDVLDGPFLMPSGSFGLLVSLRGRGGGAMPSPAELHWNRDVPVGMRTSPVEVFLRRGEDTVYLGPADFSRRGKPATDGWKVAFRLNAPLGESEWRDLVARANEPLPPPPEEAIALLGRRSTTDERIEAMCSLVDRWYGSPEAALGRISSIAQRPLRAFYEATAGHEIGALNRVLSPEELEVESDRLVFYVENQGTCVWATDGDGDDRPAYVRSNHHGAAWERETDSLSAFLIGLLVLEATIGAPFGASHDGLGARDLAKLARHAKPLPIDPWASSRTRFFGSGGVIGFARPEGQEFAVWLGAKHRARLEPLEAMVADWPDVRF